MNLCSAFLRQLAQMELAWRQIDVENSNHFEQIEADYMKWLKEWEAKYEEAERHPFEFEGGSMELLDCELRLYRLICDQREELEAKWKNRDMTSYSKDVSVN